MSAAFPEIAELKLIICGPNIFGPLFDKISRVLRVLEHSTPENKKKKNSKIISNQKKRPEKKKKIPEK